MSVCHSFCCVSLDICSNKYLLWLSMPSIMYSGILALNFGTSRSLETTGLTILSSFTLIFSLRINCKQKKPRFHTKPGFTHYLLPNTTDQKLTCIPVKNTVSSSLSSASTYSTPITRSTSVVNSRRASTPTEW